MPCENWLEWQDLRFTNEALLLEALRATCGEDATIAAYGFVSKDGALAWEPAWLSVSAARRVRQMGGSKSFALATKIAYSEAVVRKTKLAYRGVVKRRETAKEIVLTVRY